MRHLVLSLFLATAAYAKPVSPPAVVPAKPAVQGAKRPSPTTIPKLVAQAALIANLEFRLADATLERAKAEFEKARAKWAKIVADLKAAYDIDVEALEGWDDEGAVDSFKLRRNPRPEKKQ